MTPEPSEQGSGLPDVAGMLHQIAQLLHHTPHLSAESQRALADLIDGVSQAITPAAASHPEEAQQVLRSAAEVVRELRKEEPHPVVLQESGQQLRDALLRIESASPAATLAVGKIADTLAQLGI